MCFFIPLVTKNQGFQCLWGGIKVLSRRKPGFDSRWDHHIDNKGFQRFCWEPFVFVINDFPTLFPTFDYKIRVNTGKQLSIQPPHFNFDRGEYREGFQFFITLPRVIGPWKPFNYPLTS